MNSFHPGPRGGSLRSLRSPRAAGVGAAASLRCLAIAFALGAASASTLADPGAGGRRSVRDAKLECQKELARRGHANVRIRRPDFTESRVGYSYNGQFSQRAVRHEFTCVFNKKLEMSDVVVNPIPG